jgi:hypothetical protein
MQSYRPNVLPPLKTSSVLRDGPPSRHSNDDEGSIGVRGGAINAPERIVCTLIFGIWAYEYSPVVVLERELDESRPAKAGCAPFIDASIEVATAAVQTS